MPVMSQMDLSPETRLFYNLLKGVTVGAILLIVSAGMLVSYHKAEKAAEEALRRVPIGKRKEEGAGAGASSAMVSRLPVWEDDGSHPSAKLTTTKYKPRLFPFPLGKAAADKSNLYFESGNPMEIGHFGKAGEPYSQRLASASKSGRDVNNTSQRLDAIRRYEFSKRRMQWKRRLTHLKALCIVIILSYVHTYLAIIALVILIWRVFHSEFERVTTAEPGRGIHEPYAARWGTETKGRGTQGESREQSTPAPGLGHAYIYRPRNGAPEDLKMVSALPILGSGGTLPLITSMDERFNGRQAPIGDTNKMFGGGGKGPSKKASDDAGSDMKGSVREGVKKTETKR